MINKMLNNMRNIIKKSYMDFPVTNISIFIITFCFIFLEDFKLFEDILLIVFTFSVGCYFIETRKMNKLYYCASMIISFFFWFFVKDDLYGIEINFITKLYVVYILSVLIYTLYRNYINSKKEFSLYLENVYNSFFKLSFIYGILALSIFIIILLFNNLVIDVITDEMMIDVEIFLLGIYYISNIIYVFKGENDNEGTFFKTLMKKILNPLLYVSVIIIYLFIIRLFIDGDIDSNYVFYVVSYLFLIGVPLILISSSYKENNFIDKINNYSSYIYIPFVLLQLYLIINKINLGGISEDTYMWVMILIFELFYLIYSFKKIDYGNLFKVLIGLIFIIYIVPFINLEDLVDYSQFNNLKLYKIKSEYTNIEKNRIYNAYLHFDYYDDRYQEYFDKLDITDEDKKIIRCFNKDYCYEDDYSNYDDYDYISAIREIDFIDIDGYDKLYKFDSSEYDLNIKYIDFLKIKYIDGFIDIDFKDYYYKYYQNKNNFRNYFIDNNIILIDDKYKVILTRYSVNLRNNIVTGYDIEGYLLIKEDIILGNDLNLE